MKMNGTHLWGHLQAALTHPHQILKLKKIVDMTPSNFLRDLPFSYTQPPKLADK